ncbi:MAG TPA: aminotransferase class I/II-fold pyridoxal phosphate-dependent enzyme, partial [Chitinophagales bacterium]|nr:aminotransferase class I/II-fold pyridoxal phosphate-dependent enzyme [Chitinophagales bacterium]
VQPMATERKILSHNEPIFATTAYGFESLDHANMLFDDPSKGYVYSRWGNPTIEMAEKKIALLETSGSDIDATAQLFSSGMAAIAAAMTSCATSGDTILTQHQLYGTTDELMQKQLAAWNINTMRMDLNDFDAVEKALKKNKKITLVYIETPSNPMMSVTDIQTVAEIAHRYGRMVAVDNTFASPYCQKPLLLGADLVIHSATKYLNGHGNGLGGVVVSRDRNFMRERIWMKVKLLGANSNAFDSWLLLQGMKTLEIRMQRHCDNAAVVAAFLSDHHAVKKVHYCGHKDHPQRNIINRQMSDYSGMLSFELKGGLKAGKKLMQSVKLCNVITTLGTLDTLIQHPASMTHVNVPKERRLAAGISDGLVRMSVGIENAADILNDLEQGMK